MRKLSMILWLGIVTLGVLITRHYGESWDELKFYKYADSALEAYTTWPTMGQIQLTGNTYDDYGPAYVMAVALGARGLSAFVPWSQSDLRHLLYFLSFLAGLWAFYQLAKRWLAPGAAVGATALFAAQPLLWGHAFISPKDIPFLSLFLLAVHFGLKYFDRSETFSFEQLEPRSKQVLLASSALWLLLILLIFGGTPLVHAWLDSTIRAAAAGQNNIIARLASDVHKVKPEVYIQKFFVLFLQGRAVLFFISTAVLVFLYYRLAPALLRQLGALLLPAVLLGVAVGVRVLGPLAGLLVAVYALRKRGRRALPALLAYGLLALFAMYATWPYLWPDPVGHFLESIIVMAKYPWKGQLLFNGANYASTDIPRSYLPVLLGIQLTEPVWPLFAVGLGLMIYEAVKKRDRSIQLLALTMIWFVLPLFAFIAARSPLYDNFRQIFFILPPVFLAAGVVFERIRPRLLQGAVVLFCILPGLLAGIQLHPYEYIYYNQFIGGEAGAFRRFELDYWGTSYREAAAWLNTSASANAAIWADGPAHLLGMYLRPDLKLYSSYEAERADHYDYIVSTSRYNLDLTSYPNAKLVHNISRDGAVLTAIKEP